MLSEFYAKMGNPPEMTGALSLMANDLLKEGISLDQIRESLRRCSMECVFPVRLPHIFQRVPGFGVNDGRPDPETAWAMCPKSDEQSVVWTDEMAVAFEGARKLLIDGDAARNKSQANHNPESIAARMAFKEAYQVEVYKARAERRPIHWTASLGWNKADRVRALSEAVVAKRLRAEHAMELAGGQFEEMRLALPAPDRQRLQLTGEVRKEKILDLPGMPGILKMLADQNELPDGIVAEARPVAARRSMEDQLADVRRLENDGKVSKQAAGKLAKSIQEAERRRK